MNIPITRYYGSKRKVLDKIWDALETHNVHFNSVLDVFGGTGVVSYFMATKGKNVIYNDILSFNCEIARALISVPKGYFTSEDALKLLNRNENIHYDSIISDHFKDIYYTDEENRIIDTVIQNIAFLDEYKRACALYVLFQSCMIKRPFNLFHRRNLNLRTNYVKSNFGNKVTWEQSFDDLFVKFTNELIESQFINPHHNIIIENCSALNLNYHADLVYIDTPYFSKNNSSIITYHNRYHFLEGLMHYNDIPLFINEAKVNKEINFGKNIEFENRKNYLSDLDALLRFHRNSIIALSYTSEGYPSIDELAYTISKYKQIVHVCYLGKHGFALNKNNKDRQEVLIIAL